MKTWLQVHQAALGMALRRLLTAPLNTLLTIIVLGIAMTLPATGWTFLDSLRGISHRAAETQEVSVFLAPDAGRGDIAELDNRFRGGGFSARFVSREDALKALQSREGFADVVAGLPRNPLPDAFVVDLSGTDPNRLEDLAGQFATWPKVAHVQLDSAWIKRLEALLRLGRMVVTLLATVFGVALAVVTFNTIRLQILAQASEIEVAMLIGATTSWLARPHLYFGTLQGALGGVAACGLVAGGLTLLREPASELVALYGGTYLLGGPDPTLAAVLVGGGGLLGWLGARLSVSLYLRQLFSREG